MPTLIFIEPDGSEKRVEASVGRSVMQAAVGAMVQGIEAACGGNCVCATCHCYVDERFAGSLTAPTDTERGMLECTPDPRANSRLTCQIPVTPELDGMIVRVAASQH